MDLSIGTIEGDRDAVAKLLGQLLSITRPATGVSIF